MKNTYRASLLVYTYKGVRTYKSHFYGIFSRDGERKAPVKLCKVEGHPPASLRTRDPGGDLAYERSLAKADEMFTEHMLKLNTDFDNANRLKQAVVIQTGRDDMKTKLADLPTLNKKRLRPKALSASQAEFQERVLTEFAKFAAARKVTFVYQVDEELADAYYKSIEDLSLNSRRNRICTISGALKRFGPFLEKSPFAHSLDVIKSARRGIVQDQYEPFTNNQLEKIFAFVRTDELLRYLVTCCAYTGLRISDACTLRWREVDLKEGIISRRAIKTGEMVYPPIHPELRKELESAQLKCSDDEEFVCPEAARIYSPEETKINVMGKKMIARALFGDTPEDAPVADTKLPGDLAVKDAIDATRFAQSKKDRLYDVFCRYSRGESYREIQKQTGHSRGQISGDISTIENLMKIRLRPAKSTGTPLYKLIEKTQVEGATGKNRRSKYSWHSFRATFVTNLMTHGINPELVREFVGHTNVQMTKKYSRAGKAHLLELFAEAGGNQLLGLYNPEEIDLTRGLATQIRSQLTKEQQLILLKQLTKNLKLPTGALKTLR